MTFQVPDHAKNDFMAVPEGDKPSLGLTPKTTMHARRVMLFHAMPRSGHHAIIDWVHKQWNGTTFHLNCCDPRKSPAPGEPRKMRVELGNGFAAGLGVLNAKAAIDPDQDYSLVTANFEGMDLRDYRSWDLEQRCTDFFVEVPKTDYQHVVVIRDPFNNVASWQRSPWPDFGHLPFDVWCTHADEALSNTHILPSLTVVNYNRWVTDISYRHLISIQLGCPMFAPDHTVVSTESSFDGFDFDGRAHAMAVLERWRVLTDAEIWDNRFVLLSAVVHRKSRELFGREFTDGVIEALLTPSHPTP